jgi:hypothetical protein
MRLLVVLFVGILESVLVGSFLLAEVRPPIILLRRQSLKTSVAGR